MKNILPLKYTGRLLFTFLFVTALLVSPKAMAQKTSVKGYVRTESGQPVTGATVCDKANKANGAITGADGSFFLNVNPDATLSVTFIGYKPQEIAVKNRTSIDIILSENTTMLDELVVIGYGSVRKKDLTGSVSSINQKIMSDKPVTSLGQALQGRAAGVYVVDNGNPQQNVSLKIRGLGTIHDSDPLYVVDGVPMSMGLNSINVEDIENIDILKDASATAIYGSRGANGVVMITTKKGKSGDGKISVKADFGMAEATNIPKMLNAAEYAQLSNDLLSAGGLATNPAWSDPASLGKGTDWIDLMFRTAKTNKYTVSYSGGNDKSNYYVSGGLADYQGIVNSVGYKRMTFQCNTEQQVKKWIKFGNNLTFSADKKTNGDYNLMDVYKSLPTQAVYEADGSYSGPSGNSLWYGDRRNQYGTSIIDKNVTDGYNLLGNIFTELSLFNGLKFKSVAGLEAKIAYATNFVPAYNWKPTSIAKSSLYKGTDRTFNYLTDNYFTYDKTFGAHQINVMAGTSLQWGVEDFFNGSKEDFLKDETNQLCNGTKILTLTGSGSEWSIASIMFRANYSYLNRYLLTATVRRDGSSRFGANHRWGTFPSFSAAWRLSDEDWFNKESWLSDVKLRAGYGVTGNQNIGNYSFASTYNTGIYSFNGTDVSTLVANKMPNPEVHWEEVKQTNAGVDLGFLKNRIRLSLDVYNKKTVDMLVPMEVPVSSGYSDIDVPSINAGSVSNKGFETTLSCDWFNTGKFAWTSDFNFSYNKNKIISLNSSTPTYYGSVEMSGNTRVHMEGYPVGSFYGWVMDGLFQNQEEVDNWAYQSGAAPGDIKFRDLDNNGVIDDKDRTIIGNPFPDFTFSLNNTLRYGNFDAEIFIQGVEGNDVFNANKIYLEEMAVAFNQYATTLNRWTGEGTSNSIPRAIYNDPNKNVRSSTRFIEDGSYIRLKTLTIGYSIPQQWLKKSGINGVRLFLSGQNLLTMTNYQGFDPEVSLDGFDMGNYPVTRSYNLGIDVNF
ncbi:MAG: TonB-dependent receptor [Bacteroidota bacterium]|nr:TonB-dependent receptor [Bacteroidota bacterium]